MKNAAPWKGGVFRYEEKFQAAFEQDFSSSLKRFSASSLESP
jgi:hypothetical protein